jgi:hypothetical protein
MAVGLPLKTTYADGDVYSASDVNDTNGTINTTAAPYAAGKNKIINGDFYFNQRNFTSNTTDSTYNFDRWLQENSGGTVTVTPQTFTPGTAPVAGYEGKNFVRMVTASQSAAGHYALYEQKIEDVRTFAGQTVTVSFWAKAASGTPNIGVTFNQTFGGGGSSTVNTSAAAVKTITTSWARYSFNVAIPSISGKTIGTVVNNALTLVIVVSTGATLVALGYANTGIQNNTFDIWGVQVEAGSTATPFQTATGTIQGELAACQRYYYRATAGNSYSIFSLGIATNSTSFPSTVVLPVTMRTSPTVVDASAANTFFLQQGSSAPTYTLTVAPTINSVITSTQLAGITSQVASGLTGNLPYNLFANNTTSAFIGFSAEL